MTIQHAKQRLAYLRKAIEAEDISYGELAELQDLIPFIDPGDTLLLEWAGVPEFPDNQEFNSTHTLKEIKEARQAVKDSN